MSFGQLGDNAEILSGFAFKSELFNTDGEGMPLIRIRDVLSGETSTFYSGDYESRFIVRSGEILIGMDGDFNRARWRGQPSLLNQRVCKITAHSRLHDGYLFHLLPQLLQVISDRTPFVTVKHLSAKDLRETKIPLPPLEEQKRIAAILDQADTLRRLRARALDRLNALGQAIFHEMFEQTDDPSTSVPLGKLVEVAAGNGFALDEQGHLTGDFPFYKVGDMNLVGNEKEMINSRNWITVEAQVRLRVRVFPAGTVIFPKIGAAIGTNKKRILGRPSCIDNNVMALIPNENVSTEFLYRFLRTIDLMTLAQPGNPPSIRKGTVEELSVPLPSRTQVERMKTRLAELDLLIANATSSLEISQALFSSLQHRAFQGKL